MTPFVVVAEPDRSRFEQIESLIRRSFQLDVVHATTFQDILLFLRGHIGAVELVLLVDGIPNAAGDEVHPFGEYLTRLVDNRLLLGGKAVIGYVYEGSLAPIAGRIQPDLVAPRPVNESSGNMFLACVGTKFFARRLPELSFDDDPLLRDQIRALGVGDTFDQGAEVLRHIIGGFFLDTVAVSRLRSGLSGAHAFRVRPGGTNPGQYILKLDSAQWKLVAEARNHPEVRGGIPNMREYKPALVKPLATAPASDYVVNSGGWYGLCYVFLGGDPFGLTLDLQQALIATSADLCRITKETPLAFDAAATDSLPAFRRKMLKLTLEWLVREWATAHASRGQALEPPWTPEDAPARSYVTLPPYRFSANLKGRILAFLETPDAGIGRRLLPGWDEAARLVQQFVTWSAPRYGAPALDAPMSMIRSPAHGDLNANNVLFCVEKPDPIFLIDFPMYQASGHALQDFARLETEIKYALMDRQECSPIQELAALDLTSAQFTLWCELEEHLRSESWLSEREWSSPGFTPNVALSLSLVQQVRTAARQVQCQAFGVADVPSFDDEYRVALLYHTLRSIAYPSLSVFKRVLAVDAAARLLNASGFGAVSSGGQIPSSSTAQTQSQGTL